MVDVRNSKRRLQLGIILLLVNCHWMFGQTHSVLTYCETKLPIQSSGISFVDLKDLKYISYPLNSEAHLKLRNNSDKKIVQAFLVFRLLDSQQQPLFDLVFYSQFFDLRKKLPVIHGSSSMDLEHPVDRGGSAELFAAADLRTLRCPTIARLTDIEIQYGDRTWQQHAEVGWQMEPEISLTSAERISPPPFSLPFEARCQISVNSSGKAVATSCVDTPEENLSWLNRVLSSWKFHPALRDSTSIDFSVDTLIFVKNFQSIRGRESEPEFTQRRMMLESFAESHRTFEMITLSPLTKDMTSWKGVWGFRDMNLLEPVASDKSEDVVKR